MEPSDASRPISYASASWYSYLSFSWINPLVEAGVERQVQFDDTPELGPNEDTLLNTRLLLRALETREEQQLGHPMIRAVMSTWWRQLFVFEVMTVCSHFLGLLSPLLMQQVLIFQEHQNDTKPLTQAETARGFRAVGALIALGFFMIFYQSQTGFFHSRVNTQINSALRGVVLFRCIQGRPVQAYGMGIGSRPHVSSAKGADKPSVYNTLSFDVGPSVDIIWILLGLWIFPIQFGSSVAVLCEQVGYATVPGLVVIVVAKFLVGIMMYFDGLLRDQLLYAKDVRLQRCNESFTAIRALHMLAWANPFRKRIMDARNDELYAQTCRLWMEKMSAALDYSLGVLVTAATLTYYTIEQGGELKASVALPVISLINGLTGPLGQFPGWLQSYLIWRSAYCRVNDFIELDANPSDSGAGARRESPAEIAAPSDGSIAGFHDCTLTWGDMGNSQENFEGDVDEESGTRQPLLDSESGFALPDLKLSVKRGEVLIVVGQEAQGKSSLLLGLLGEMPSTSGVVKSPAVARRIEEGTLEGRLNSLPENIEVARKCLDAEYGAALNPLAVPFAPQSPKILTGSIRSNITFGCPFKEALYARVLKACALTEDLAIMPVGDLTEVAQAGATLSGGQKVRIGLARTVYRAVLETLQSGTTPLVLLDDPLCSLDQRVARDISKALFGAPAGLLASCAVVVATSQPWWLPGVQSGSSEPSGGSCRLQVAVLRAGNVIAAGTPESVVSMGLPEFEGITAGDFAAGDGTSGTSTEHLAPAVNMKESNPQDLDEQEQGGDTSAGSTSLQRSKLSDSEAQTELTDEQKTIGMVIKEEHREEGQVGAKTYGTYLSAVGATRICLCVVALVCIMFFQNLTNLWIAYWTAEDMHESFVHSWLSHFTDKPPTQPRQLLAIYMCLALLFTLSNFAGHAFEITGGIAAARRIFAEALEGIFRTPFRWWDANPTGRVLNRFSEDVNVMDAAITNILGIIFGAVLYFVGHTFILALSNPWALLLLPIIAAGLEYYARYYRATIREVARINLVRTGMLYQEMVEAINARVTVRAFASERRTICSSLESLQNNQQVGFVRGHLGSWLGLRMALIGYILSFWVKLRPILQYYKVLGKQSAAMVGFSMSYSTETVGIIQQFISNYSDLEMQMISIERLGEYARLEAEARTMANSVAIQNPARGLHLSDVTVRYREGLKPALSGITLSFTPRDVTAIVGRTGAGKTSLLLAILQLVPHEGGIWVDGQLLADLSPEEVRRRLVGIVPQQPVLFAGDVRQNIDPEGHHSDEALWGALQAIGLEGKCRSEGAGLQMELAGDGENQQYKGVVLSLGQKQLLCAARVLLRQPRVVMLDEVTASLPAELAISTVSTLVRRFRECDSTVLLVTHQENLIATCGRKVTFSSGRVIDDRYTEHALPA